MLAIPAPRLLPLAIIAMTALLATRLAEIAGVGPSRLTPAGLQAGVQFGAQTAAALIPSMVPAAQAADAAPDAGPAARNPGAGGLRAAAQASAAAQGTPILPEAPAGTAPVSAAERQLLEDLRARRLALEEREQVLVARESVLAATEARLGARVQELAAMQARLEALDRAAREREDSNWANLVRIYENMRPRDAARIFDDLDMPVLIEVVARMKQRSVAPILAGMQPDRAQRVTTELAARRARGPDGG